MEFPMPIVIANIKQEVSGEYMDEVEIPIPEWMESVKNEKDPLEIAKIETDIVKEEPTEEGTEMIWKEENDDNTLIHNEMSIKLETPKTEVGLYTCDKCSFSSDNVSSDVLGTEMIWKEENDDNTLIHNEMSIKLETPKTEVGLYTCDNCSFSSDNVSSDVLGTEMIWKEENDDNTLIHNEMSIKLETPKTEVGLYTCDKCSFSSDNVSSDVLGTEMIWKEEKDDNTLIHNEMSIKLETPKTEVGLYTCDKCSFSSDNNEDLEGHMISHNVEGVGEEPRCSTNNFIQENVSPIEENQMRTLTFEKSILIYNNTVEDMTVFCDSKSLRPCYIKQHIVSKHTGEKPQCCKFCDYKCIRVGTLKKHILIKHTENKLRSCSFCTFRFINNSRLRLHIMKKHTSEGPYTCDYCKLKFPRLGLLRNHIATIHKYKKSYTQLCSICDYKCDTFYDLEVHMMYTHNIKPLVCKLCANTCYDESNLKEHVRINHCIRDKSCCHFCDYKCVYSSTTKEQNDSPSNMCNVKCNNPMALNKHIMREHTAEKLKSCNYCVFKYIIPEALKIHISVAHSNKLRRCKFCLFTASDDIILLDHIKDQHPSEKSYQCTLCDYKCYDFIMLEEHLRKHIGVATPSCNLCDFKCTYPYMLRNHMNLKHLGEKIHACTACDFKCVIYNGLLKHLLTNHTDTLLKCNYCGYICDGNIITEHIMLEHSDETALSCSLCDYTCDNVILLKEHTNSHIDDDQQSCNQCDFKCIYPCYLEKHIQNKHTDGSSVCNFCEYNYSNYNDLSNHLLKYHVNKLLNCRFCDYKCYDTTILKDHVMEKHIIKTAYACNFCDFTTFNSNTLESHVLNKHKPIKRKVYSCKLCDYKVICPHALRKHVLKEHPKNAVIKQN